MTMSSNARAEAIRTAIKNFVPSPHGVSVLRSEVLKATAGTELDGRGICNVFVPVGINNPANQRGLSGLETIATLIEIDPTLRSAEVFTTVEILGGSGYQVVSELKQVLPQNVKVGDVLPFEYTANKLHDDLGL